MFSQRGVMNLAHNEHDIKEMKRRISANRLNGLDTKWLDTKEIKELVPIMNTDNLRYPVLGAAYQPRGGVARHDAIAWGFAMRADEMGVDIIQNCEVTGFQMKNGKCLGVQTNQGLIKAKKTAVCVAGASSRVMEKAGMRLPIESHVLQAFVSEGLKPTIPGVITYGAGHFYVSQSDKGGLVFGGDLDLSLIHI